MNSKSSVLESEPQSLTFTDVLIHSVGQSINHLLSNLPHDLNFNHKYKKKGQEKNDFK